MAHSTKAAKSTSPRPFWDFVALECPLSPDQAIERGIQLAAALERYKDGFGRLTPEMLVFGQDTTSINDVKSDTPLLLAPEILLSKESIGQDANNNHLAPLADVWSIGVVVYILLTGHGPFGGITRRQQVRAITRHGPTPDIRTVRPDVSDDLAGVLYHMLQRSVESRSAIPNSEMVRRAFGLIQAGQPTPYSIPEFPVVEAKAILKEASQRSGMLSESEFQFIRRLVDKQELTIGDDTAQLWRHSQRRALLRRFVARLIFACLLGLSAPVFVGVIDAVVLPSNPLIIHLAQAAAAFAFMVVMNCDSIGIITFTSHRNKSSRPPWWVLPASMAVLGGLVQVTVYALGITPLYATAAEAFEVGALTGLALGVLYTLSMPGERQDTILKQSRRPLAIGGVIGLAYGVYYLATQLPQDETAAVPYFVLISILGVPLIIIGLLLSFVLGVELGDRYIER